MVFTRKVDLSEWTNIDEAKPAKNQSCSICDADSEGYADYEYEAVFDGDDFSMDKFGRIRGVTYWKPSKQIKTVMTEEQKQQEIKEQAALIAEIEKKVELAKLELATARKKLKIISK